MPLTTHRCRVIHSYDDSFTGEEAVKYCVLAFQSADLALALQFGDFLLENEIIAPVSLKMAGPFLGKKTQIYKFTVRPHSLPLPL